MAEKDPALCRARARTVVLTERHDDGHRPLSDRCQDAFADSAAIRSIAHFGNGIIDFAVRPENARPLPNTTLVTEDPLESEGAMGRQLIRSFQDLDTELNRFQTGDLMRMVVQTRSCGLYCGRVRARQHLVGVTLDSDVPALDEAMNRLVTRLRTEVYNLPDENPGGAEGASRAELDTVQKLTFEGGLRHDPARVGQLRGIWHRFVNPTDLQYASYFQHWTLTCAGDAFEDPGLSPRFLDMTASARRALYRDLAGRLRGTVARLQDVLRPITRDPIDRLVLDVQEGAVYLHRLPTGLDDLVIGVTMDQFLVGRAEQRLRELVSEIPAPPRP